MNANHNLQTPKLIGAVVITAVLMIGVYFLILDNKPSSSSKVATINPITSSTPATSTPAAAPTPTPAASSTGSTATSMTTTMTMSAYKDGTYTASADYNVPGDTNTIKVTLTVKNGSITAADTQHSYGERESARYIGSFVSALSGTVVGKQLDAAQVNRLSGASDTSIGFDQALTTIISQAKA